MNTVLITGSNGLIGSAAVSFFANKADLNIISGLVFFDLMRDIIKDLRFICRLTI